jgi:hypothetical protein
MRCLCTNTWPGRLPLMPWIIPPPLLTNRASVTIPLAPCLFAARVVQSCVHLTSLSVPP